MYRLTLPAVVVAALLVGCNDQAPATPAATPPAPTASAPPAEPVGPAVLSVANVSANGMVNLTPIAVVENGRLREAGGESQDQQAAFLAAHFGAGHAHSLLVGGQRVGTVAVASADVSEVGYGLHATGTARFDGPTPLEWTGLSGGAGSARPLRRPVTPAERRIFLDIASGQLGYRWLDFDRDGLEYGMRVVALEGFGRPVLIGTVETDGPYGATDSFGEPAVYTAFVVAEVGEGGEYQGVFRRLGEGVGYEDGEGKARLLDVADLDGDGTPEVVVEINRYEGTDYEVYGRRGGQWQPLFRGGYVGV